MRLRDWSLVLGLSFLSLLGCGGSSPVQPIASSDDAAERYEPSPREGAGRYRAPPPSAATPSAPDQAAPQRYGGRGESKAAPSARSSAGDDAWGPTEERERSAEPHRRPGLATRWGEERESHIRETFFDRSDAPAELLRVFYDDERGVEAASGRPSRFAHAGVFPVLGGALTVSVVDSSGDPLPALVSGGSNYVIGDQGDRYQIRITNHTPGRFEVVASVDGLDVIDGQDGAWSKRGYLVNAWSSLDIEGFRDSSQSVRAFRFGDVEESYAVLRGKGRNVGVIGVALFAERGYDFPPYGEVERRRQADPFPGRFAPAPQSW